MNFRATLTMLTVLAALGVAAAPAQATSPAADGGAFDPVSAARTWPSTADGFAATSGNGLSTTTGSAFNPGSFYSYTLDPAADVPSLLRTYAGPQANIGT
ncbi:MULTISPECIES: hypothetical protein [unclassified Nonomuraea]|uniref:hypothetical protein n=1 Tax=unclassified Nonomuraea TaxID=2593643 RepID=UPI0033F443EA